MTEKRKSFKVLYERAERRDSYWIADAVLDLTTQVCRLMERQGVSRAELARRLEVAPSYVSKVLRGDANFTIASMVRIARALGAQFSPVLISSAQFTQESTVTAATRIVIGDARGGGDARRVRHDATRAGSGQLVSPRTAPAPRGGLLRSPPRSRRGRAGSRSPRASRP